jgi:uncharacterized membrane protein YgdD (TMEM256/DUF423 family)
MNARTLAAYFGAVGVALGAIGAHAFKDLTTYEFWRTATIYHLIHAAVMLGSGRSDGRPSESTVWFAAGITLFSGSLYAMVLTDSRALGIITMFGGIALIVGWVKLRTRND